MFYFYEAKPEAGDAASALFVSLAAVLPIFAEQIDQIAFFFLIFLANLQQQLHPSKLFTYFF